MAQDVLIAT